MANTTDENYVTESIFVPLYNRSQGLRDLISKKFGQKVAFGNHIEFTGNNNKRSGGEYGFPDATTDEGNYIEIKINYGGLKSREAEGGDENGNGYYKYLNEKKDKHLLYLVPDDYEDNFVKNERSKVMYWSEIIKYLRTHDEYDPNIAHLIQKVEGLEGKDARTIATYKAKFFEILLRVMSNNNTISFQINDESNLFNIPQEITNSNYDVIEFHYNDSYKQEYNLCINKDEIFLLLPCEFTPFYNKGAKQSFIDHNYEGTTLKKLTVVSIKDFWDKEYEELANILDKKIKTYIKEYDVTEKTMNSYKEKYEKEFLKKLETYATKHSLEFSHEDDNMTFYFKKTDEKWKYAFQFENEHNYTEPVPFFLRDFLYGFYWEGNKKERKKYVNIIKDSISDKEGEWVSYKYYDDPYRHWGIDVFNEFENNPEKFIEKLIGSKIKEIDNAVLGIK